MSIVSVPDLEAKQRSANGVISAVKAEEKRERKAAKSNSTEDGIKCHLSNSKTPKRRQAERIERSLQDLAEGKCYFMLLN